MKRPRLPQKLVSFSASLKMVGRLPIRFIDLASCVELRSIFTHSPPICCYFFLTELNLMFGETARATLPRLAVCDARWAPGLERSVEIKTDLVQIPLTGCSIYCLRISSSHPPLKRQLACFGVVLRNFVLDVDIPLKPRWRLRLRLKQTIVWHRRLFLDVGDTAMQICHMYCLLFIVCMRFSTCVLSCPECFLLVTRIHDIQKKRCSLAHVNEKYLPLVP